MRRKVKTDEEEKEDRERMMMCKSREEGKKRS